MAIGCALFWLKCRLSYDIKKCIWQFQAKYDHKSIDNSINRIGCQLWLKIASLFAHEHTNNRAQSTKKKKCIPLIYCIHLHRKINIFYYLIIAIIRILFAFNTCLIGDDDSFANAATICHHFYLHNAQEIAHTRARWFNKLLLRMISQMIKLNWVFYFLIHLNDKQNLTVWFQF